MKYSKTLLTTTLIWRPLFKLTSNFYSLLLSQLPFSSSFESLFYQTNIRDSAVIRAQSFSVAQNVPKWRQCVNKGWFSHGTVCTNKFKYLLGNPFLGPPFLKKGPLKLQKGAHLTLIGQFLESTLLLVAWLCQGIAFDVLVAVFVSFAYNPAVLCFVGW